MCEDTFSYNVFSSVWAVLFLLIKPSIRALNRLGANKHPLSDCYQGDRSSNQYMTPPSRRAPIVSINDSSVNLKLSDANKPRVLCGQLPHWKTRSYRCEQHARAADLEDKQGPPMWFSSVGESVRHLQSIRIYPVGESGEGFHRRESVRPKQEDENVHGSTPFSHPWNVKCTPTVTNSLAAIIWKHDTLPFLFPGMWAQVNPSIPPFISHQDALVSRSFALPLHRWWRNVFA